MRAETPGCGPGAGPEGRAAGLQLRAAGVGCDRRGGQGPWPAEEVWRPKAPAPAHPQLSPLLPQPCGDLCTERGSCNQGNRRLVPAVSGESLPPGWVNTASGQPAPCCPGLGGFGRAVERGPLSSWWGGAGAQHAGPTPSCTDRLGFHKGAGNPESDPVQLNSQRDCLWGGGRAPGTMPRCARALGREQGGVHPSSVLESRNLSGLGGARLSQGGPRGSACPPPGTCQTQEGPVRPVWNMQTRGGLSRTPFPRDRTPPPGLLHLGRGGAEAEGVSPPHTVRSHFRAGAQRAVRAGRSHLLWASPVAENSVGWSHGAVTAPRLSTADQPLVPWRPT